MFRKVVICLILVTLIGFVSCKKKDSADGAPVVTDEILNEIFGDGSESGDFLPEGTDPECGHKFCDEDAEETVESCPVDCDPNFKPKANPNSPALNISIDGDEDALKQAYVIIATVKMKSFTGEVTFDYEIDVSDIVKIDVEEEFDESNKIKYAITGSEPGDAVIKFKAINDADTGEVFEKEIKITVVNNEVENKSNVDSTEILAVDQDLTLTLKSKDGSEEDLEWNKTTVNYAYEGDNYSTADAGYYQLIKSEGVGDSSDIIESYRFSMVGKFELITSVTDHKYGFTSEKPIEITVTEDAAVNVYVHDIEEGTLTAIPDSSDVEIQFGHQEVVVGVTGYDDNYDCIQYGNLKASESAEINLVFEPFVVPEMVDGKAIFCKVYSDMEYNSSNKDLIGPEGVTVPGVKISINGDYLEEVLKSFDVNIVLHPTDIELELALHSFDETQPYDENLDVGEYIQDMIDYSTDLDEESEELEGYDVELFAPIDVIFEVKGGVPPYKWSLESEVPETLDMNWNPIVSDAENRTWEKNSKPKDAEDAGGSIDSKKKVKNRHYFQISGEFSYSGQLPVEGLDPRKDPYELWVLIVEDADGKKFKQTFKFNLKWPSLEDMKLSSLLVQMNVNDVTDTDDDTKLTIEFVRGSDVLGRVKHGLDDCGDYEPDADCEEQRKVEFKNNDKWSIDHSSDATLADITEIRVIVTDPNAGWLNWSKLDVDLITITFWNTYYHTKYWDDKKNDTGVSGKGLNDNVSPKEFNLIRDYMLEQLGFSSGDPVFYVWKRKTLPINMN